MINYIKFTYNSGNYIEHFADNVTRPTSTISYTLQQNEYIKTIYYSNRFSERTLIKGINDYLGENIVFRISDNTKDKYLSGLGQSVTTPLEDTYDILFEVVLINQL